jgi:ADP-dependent phosphofructokinase/glucokinase
MESIDELKRDWAEKYRTVPQQLRRVSEVKSVATAFNTNIDAVLKISGKRLEELIKQTNLTESEVAAENTRLLSGKDVVRGIIKCFTLGIAEEWITDDKSVDDWMQQNLGYDRLQMGGQGGIVANALAVLGVQNVLVHTNSHPRLQAEQFLDLPNLSAVDVDGQPKPARKIDRIADTPLIHRIIEFDIGDSFTAFGKTFTCPKSNRFIATYDPANIDLRINSGFVTQLNTQGYEYLILSGYHNLTSQRNGVNLVKNSVDIIKNWKRKNPQGIIHLELASTQDIEVRRAIMEEIAPLSDSLGMNERETLEALEVTDAEKFHNLINRQLSAPLLFDAALSIKKKTGVKRVQLHIFGLYITIQSKEFPITPQQNLRGMMLAATVAATKAGIGKIEKYDDLLWAQGMFVADTGLHELRLLADYTDNARLLTQGIGTFEGENVIAVPTILIEKPLTLVGMGDTISSVSLIGAR